MSVTSKDQDPTVLVDRLMSVEASRRVTRLDASVVVLSQMCGNLDDLIATDPSTLATHQLVRLVKHLRGHVRVLNVELDDQRRLVESACRWYDQKCAELDFEKRLKSAIQAQANQELERARIAEAKVVELEKKLIELNAVVRGDGAHPEAYDSSLEKTALLFPERQGSKTHCTLCAITPECDEALCDCECHLTVEVS